jgi:hypothetical protein
MKGLLITAVLASFLTLSCQKLFFSDEENSRKIMLEDFQAVKISGIYDILLVQDSENKLIITGKNDINSVDAIIVDDTLVIRDHKKKLFNPNRNTLTLHFRSLGHIITYDPVKITNSDTIHSNRLFYDALGEIAEASLTVVCNYFQLVNSANTLGTFNIYGKTEYCSFFNRYGSSIDAGGLTCKYADITNESVGDVYVNASENLRVYIWGPGSIYYYGNPFTEIAERNGEGLLVRLRTPTGKK